MLNLLNDCIDELCYKCGKYANEHEGACKGCKWYSVKTKGYYDGKLDRFSMVDLAKDMKFFCESGDDCEDCPVYDDGYCSVGTPCEWVIKEV